MANDKVSEPKVKLNGTDVPSDALQGLIVEQDVDQPDMATITLNNTSDFHYSTTANLGDSLDVDIAQTNASPLNIFKGEVVGIEPHYDLGGDTKVIIRAFSRLHRLGRGKKSRTFEKKTDGDIAKKIAQEASLTPKISGDVNITYAHVYQHNQTDMEFLLHRASRINYEVLVEDKNLIFRKRDTSTDSGITLEWGKDAETAEYSLQKFIGRLVSSGQVQEVKVHAWDPEKAEEIVGSANSLDKKLGSDDGGGKAKTAWGKAVHYEHDLPVTSKEEADAIAKSRLETLSMNYITGEATAKGHPSIKAGIVVKIKCHDSRFDGSYYIIAARHNFSHKSGGGGGGGGGYLTHIKVRRNAEGGEGGSGSGGSGGLAKAE